MWKLSCLFVTYNEKSDFLNIQNSGSGPRFCKTKQQTKESNDNHDENTNQIDKFVIYKTVYKKSYVVLYPKCHLKTIVESVGIGEHSGMRINAKHLKYQKSLKDNKDLRK